MGDLPPLVIDAVLQRTRPQFRVGPMGAGGGELGVDAPSPSAGVVPEEEEEVHVGAELSGYYFHRGHYYANLKMPALATFALVVAVVVPCFLVLEAFSVMRSGHDLYRWAADLPEYWILFSMLALFVVVTLYILDALHWQRRSLVWLRRVLIASAAICAGFSTVFATEDYPWAPMLFAVLIIPLSVAGARTYVLGRYPSSAIYHSLAWILLILAITLLVIFTLWVFALPPPDARLNADPPWQRNWTNFYSKEYWRTRLDCNNTQSLEDCHLAAFLWWFFPCILAVPLLLFAAVSHLLSHAVRTPGGDADLSAPSTPLALRSEPSNGPSNGPNGPGESSVSSRKSNTRRSRKSDFIQQKVDRVILRIVLLGMTLGVLALYVAASIAGAGIDVTTPLCMGVFLLVSVMIIVVGNALGWDELQESVGRGSVIRTLKSNSSFFDWGRAGLVFFAWWAMVAFLLIDATNQLMRRILPDTVTERHVPGNPTHFSRHFTPPTRKKIQKMASWHWGSVLSKVTILGLFYLSLWVLVAKATVVLLSWLNEELSSLAISTVIIVFLVVGLLMFLVPVIPGVPVYILSGVLVPSALMNADLSPNATSNITWVDELDPDDAMPPPAFWTGLLVAVLCSSLLKMVAIILQQEGIGRFGKRYVQVRSLCAVNTHTMRAIKLILQRPGISVAKTAILVGGPDWPTSVISGVMGLNIIQMLIGSIPVVFLIAPCVLTGGFLLIGVVSDIWETASNLVTLATLAVQGGAMVGMLIVVQRASVEMQEQLTEEAMPLDEEVRAYDRKQERFKAKRSELTHWRTGGVPLWDRMLTATATVLVLISCYASVLLTTFRSFSLSDSINNPLEAPQCDDTIANPCGLGGKWLNIVYPPTGWVVVVFYIVASLMLYVHYKWVALAVKDALRKEDEPTVNALPGVPLQRVPLQRVPLQRVPQQSLPPVGLADGGVCAAAEGGEMGGGALSTVSSEGSTKLDV